MIFPLLDKLQFPIGSMVVDTALVISLFVGNVRMADQLENMNARLASVENNVSTEKLAQRTAMLEQMMQQNAVAISNSRAEFSSGIQRLNDKFDRQADRMDEARHR